MSTTTSPLQAGQSYDPGYPVPTLAIGQPVGSGRTVTAAIRQLDRPGLLPGLHIVTAYGPGEVQAWVTWEVAWQPGHGWSAGSGHYFYDQEEALRDMVLRAGWHPLGRD